MSDSLGMGTDEMRSLGHWLVDRVVDDLIARREGPAIRSGEAGALQALLGGPVPRAPGDPRACLETLVECLGHMQHGDHPRYFARVPGPSSFAGVLGDWLATGANAIAASWGGGSGPSMVELVVIGWLAELLGFPEGTEGLVLSGGSISNLTAFALARATLGDGVAYLSDQAHSSLRRGLRVLGFPDAAVRVLETGDDQRLSAASLAEAVGRDLRSGATPRLVIATAGTTNTGAVDELGAIAEVCAGHDLWFHVDGAYGAPAALCADGRHALEGIDRADSLTLDPHKWLFSPYDAGVLLTRRPGALERTFGMRPDYLADVRSAAAHEVDFGSRGPELTRPARALKLWMVLRVYGLDAIGDAIRQGIELARLAERLIDADPWWELVTPAQLGIVTFTHPGWSAEEHAASAAALATDGFAAVTSTSVGTRPALRLCTINPRTTGDDLTATLARLRGPGDG